MPSLIVYQNYVHGQYISNGTGEAFEVINPATGQVSYLVEEANEAVQQAAVESAKSGFAEWSKMTAVERSRILLKAAALLREHNDELAAGEVLDTGKPWQEASVVDVVTGADSIEFLQALPQVLKVISSRLVMIFIIHVANH